MVVWLGFQVGRKRTWGANSREHIFIDLFQFFGHFLVTSFAGGKKIKLDFVL